MLKSLYEFSTVKKSENFLIAQPRYKNFENSPLYNTALNLKVELTTFLIDDSEQ